MFTTMNIVHGHSGSDASSAPQRGAARDPALAAARVDRGAPGRQDRCRAGEPGGMDGATRRELAARAAAAVPVGRYRAAHCHHHRPCGRATPVEEKTMMRDTARRLAPL